ncbi:hypothetical protein TTHERM_000080033 (macronuclear) [Tetrahymena thermophila SB210]|uniref:Transmembrane protein n=1 Tax=Tetrahymena thermophila (strain SB210) TaxID=312017 RepID=W7XJZ9_TETTS|nr:hypothetical protein TTHERM_000080033 [Tetrahymena thermophila SB210]EWS74469.1 hypothetical protein TTHERM_000080033 [Tetrahymena thermophila SB210]|eukprot:XP_012653046.1 hypothetical protein TTHERM_000080033 [Tetrahymena thermophila SB210]
MIVLLTFILFLKSACKFRKIKEKFQQNYFKVSIINTETYTKYIEFNLDKCAYTGFLTIIGSYTCPIQVQVGSPGQQLTLSIAINRIVPNDQLQSATSFLLSSECILQNKCISFFIQKKFDEAFNPELTSSLNKTGINYSNTITQTAFHNFQSIYQINGTILRINGEYQSDLFQISEEVEQKIRIPFVLVNSMWAFNAPTFGILNFERHNMNSLILQGYLQNQLKTPKFAITIENKVGKIIYDEIPKYLNNAIEIKTKSSDLWDLKITGMILEDKDVLPLAHFQSLEFTLYPFTQLPKGSQILTIMHKNLTYTNKIKGIVNYLLKKYSHLLIKHENTVQLQDCEHCSCLEKLNFPDLKIYTEKVMITLTPKQYFSENQSKNICQIVISMDKIMLSSKFYQDYPTIFNTKNGSIAIFKYLNQM